MFKSPYSTRACKSHQMDDIYTDLKTMMIQGDIGVSPIGQRDDVLVIDERQSHIRPFAHPIPMLRSNGENVVIYDARGISRLDKTSGSLKVTKELIFSDLIATLMLRTWLDTDGKDLLNLGEIAIKAFAKAFSENVGRRTKLDITSMMYIEIVAGYYYCCLHLREDLFDDGDKMKLIKRVSRSLGYPESTVESTIHDVPYLGSIESLTQAIATSGRSVILEKINPGYIYTLLGGLWFGPHAREVAAVSLEYPPVFVAMVYMITIDKSYRKTILSNILDLIDRRKERRMHLVTAINRVRVL